MSTIYKETKKNSINFSSTPLPGSKNIDNLILLIFDNFRF